MSFAAANYHHGCIRGIECPIWSQNIPICLRLACVVLCTKIALSSSDHLAYLTAWRCISASNTFRSWSKRFCSEFCLFQKTVALLLEQTAHLYRTTLCIIPVSPVIAAGVGHSSTLANDGQQLNATAYEIFFVLYYQPKRRLSTMKKTGFKLSSTDGFEFRNTSRAPTKVSLEFPLRRIRRKTAIEDSRWTHLSLAWLWGRLTKLGEKIKQMNQNITH